jgi:hypothetical protein
VLPTWYQLLKSRNVECSLVRRTVHERSGGVEGREVDRDADVKEISEKHTEKRIGRRKTVVQVRVLGGS